MSEKDVHVVPLTIDGATDHASEATCWCQPVATYEEPLSGGRVYVHRRYIDGPVIERSDGGIIDDRSVVS